jgi:hypothetical protein
MRLSIARGAIARGFARPLRTARAHRVWTALVVVAVLVRIALPFALRPILESQVSDALGARVVVGNVDLALLRGVVSLRDVMLLPAAEYDSAEPPPPNPAEALIAWKRFSVNLSWLALLRRRLAFSDVVLDGPIVRIERLRNGSINLVDLFTSNEQPATEAKPAEAEQAPSAWSYAVDRLRLRRGTITFHDLRVEGTHPVSLEIDDITAHDVAWPVSTSDETSAFGLEAAVDGGTLRIDGNIQEPRPDAFRIEVRLDAHNWRLVNGRAYVAPFGYQDLRGLVDVSATYLLDGDEQHVVDATATVHNASLEVPALDEPPLRWDVLKIENAHVDLLTRHAEVDRVALTGADLVVDPRGKSILPVLPRTPTSDGASDAAGGGVAAAPAATSGTGRSAGAGGAAAPAISNASAGAPADTGTNDPAHGKTAAEAAAIAADGHGATSAAGTGVGADAGARDEAHAAVNVETSATANGHSADAPAVPAARATAAATADAVAETAAQPPVPATAPGTVDGAKADAAADAAVDARGAGAAAPRPAAAAADAEAETEAAAIDASAGTKAESEAGAWSWSLGDVSIEKSTVHVLTVGKPLDLDVGARVRSLTSAGHDEMPVELVVTEGTSSLELTGKATMQPVAFDAELEWKDLSFPRLLAAVPGETAAAVRGGTSSGKLEVSGGSLPSAKHGTGEQSRAVRASGRVTIGGLAVHTKDPDLFTLAWNALDVDLDSVEVPDLLPAAPDAATAAAGGEDAAGGTASAAAPIRVSLASLSLAEPHVRLTRTGSGFVLPGQATPDHEAQSVDSSATSPSGGTTPSTGSDASATTKAAEVEQPSQAASPGEAGANAPVDLAIGTLAIRDARFEVDDRTFSRPLLASLFTDHLDARSIEWPRREALAIDAAGRTMQTGRWTVTGDVKPTSGALRVTLERVPLVPFGGIASDLSGYGIERGDASLTTAIDLTGDGYETDNDLVLHDLLIDTPGNVHGFQDEFGIPLSLALALLRDPSGDISLNLPVSGDRSGTSAGFMTALGGVLRQAIVGAVTSPLKMVGAVLLKGDKVQGLAVQAITFQAGSTEPTPEATDQIASLARLLAPRPALAVGLAGRIARADVEVWQRQKLLARLQAGDDFPDLGFLQARRLRRYLEDEAAGKQAELGDDDRAALERLADAQKITPEELHEVAHARAQRVANVLRDDYDVAPDQIRMAGAAAGTAPNASATPVEVSDDTPAVTIEIESVGRPASSQAAGRTP